MVEFNNFFYFRSVFGKKYCLFFQNRKEGLEESCVQVYPGLGAARTSSLLFLLARCCSGGVCLAPGVLAWLEGCCWHGICGVCCLSGATGTLAFLVFTVDLIILLERVSLQPSRGYFEYEVVKKCRSEYW